jgi:hypothetical protein
VGKEETVGPVLAMAGAFCLLRLSRNKRDILPSVFFLSVFFLLPVFLTIVP